VVWSDIMDVNLGYYVFVKVFEDILHEQGVPFSVLEKNEEDTNANTTVTTSQ
jgi:hypothetical protein